MANLFNLLESKFQAKQKIILSLDLDYTVVDRSVSGNYIDPENLNLLKNLKKSNSIILLPNTGRELYGFNSFISQGLSLENGVFASGRVTRVQDKDYFNKKGVIEDSLVHEFLSHVDQGRINFIDIAYFNDRDLIYKDKSEIFFSQNPSEWFNEKFPNHYHVKNYDRPIKDTYRLEFPVFENETLYKYIDSNERILTEKFIETYKIKTDFDGNYSIKKKKHYYNGKSSRPFFYIRIEKRSEDLGKGEGIKNWLNQSDFNINDFCIVHIGDQDSGLINDTEVKTAIPESILLMVGERCNPNNSLLDLYLSKDSNLGVKMILTDIQKLITKYEK